MNSLARFLVHATAALFLAGSAFSASLPLPSAAAAPNRNAIPTYQPRFHRERAVVAVIGENGGTELTDFAIPYGVLSASGAAQVFTVATKPGDLRMRPVLTIRPDLTVAQFDLRFPDGADYVIVPAVMNYRDPALLAWIKEQSAKGGSIVSICDGAAVVASTGLLDGHKATAHWASEKNRRKLFPHVEWVADVRYVSDGTLVSTAGISAALPASLALVEAIAGSERANALAAEMGVTDWGTAHATAPFRPRFGGNLKALISTNYTNHWLHSTEMLGLPIACGVDEIALALVADAYSRTGRSMVHAIAATPEPIRTRHGLVVVPDVLKSGHVMDRMLQELDGTPSGQWLGKSVRGIAQLYGPTTAYGVALDFEYPLVPSDLPCLTRR